MNAEDSGTSDQATPLATFLLPLIGREREISDIAGRLQHDDVRMLVLTGPGGVGKTRLAMGVADMLRSSFDDGVLVVRLADVNAVPDVLPAIARAMHVCMFRTLEGVAWRTRCKLPFVADISSSCWITSSMSLRQGRSSLISWFVVRDSRLW